MPKVIYKYPLEIVDRQTLQLPLGSRLLSAEVQKNKICIWAWVDTKADSTEGVVICIFGTGNAIPSSRDEDFVHLGTLVMEPFVWHVFQAVRSNLGDADAVKD